jgi:hypothetical protein
MNKLDKIERDAQKAREKIAAAQAVLKQIEGHRTEQENMQIVHQIRNLKLSRDELYAFLRGGALPAALAAMFGGDTAAATAPETISSRRGKQRDTGPDGAEGDAETTNDDESEDTDNDK